jgi:hypothetical protein
MEEAMRSFILCSLLVMASVSVGAARADTLGPPFDTPPFIADLVGNSAFSEGQGFFRGPESTDLAVSIGTNESAGSLILDFDTPFADGDGDDFAILTSSPSWGPLADQAVFQFFLGEKLQGSFVARLAPDRLFTFDLPGEAMIADRIVVTNVTPDPPGINDDATMTFIDAGVVTSGVLRIAFDIGLPTCPNRIDRGAERFLRAAILGTRDFDVTKIDPSTLRLEGVSPLSFRYNDVATPRQNPLNCTDKGKDGFTDLVLTFDNATIGLAIASALPGDVVVLKVVGKLRDGRFIVGEDVGFVQR